MTKAELIQQTLKYIAAAPNEPNRSARWKDGTLKDPVEAFVEKHNLDLERLAVDAGYQRELAESGVWAGWIRVRAEADRERRKAENAQLANDRAAARDEYRVDDFAEQRQKDADSQAAFEKAVDDHFRSGGLTPLPKR